jgi:hypothetical protein
MAGSAPVKDVPTKLISMYIYVCRSEGTFNGVKDTWRTYEIKSQHETCTNTEDTYKSGM